MSWMRKKIDRCFDLPQIINTGRLVLIISPAASTHVRIGSMSLLAVDTLAYTTSPALRLGRLRLVAPSNESWGRSAENGALISTMKF